jgi:glycogen synthase
VRCSTPFPGFVLRSSAMAKLEQYFAGASTYFAGYLKERELPSAYASADAFFLPSRTETLGLVPLEAMASGCPVVAAAAGGILDIVRDGVTGHLFKPGNPSGATEAIRRILFDSSHSEALRRQARLDVEKWGWAAATKQIELLYRKIIHRKQQLRDQLSPANGLRGSATEICETLDISRSTLRRLMRADPAPNGHHRLLRALN